MLTPNEFYSKYKNNDFEFAQKHAEALFRAAGKMLEKGRLEVNYIDDVDDSEFGLIIPDSHVLDILREKLKPYGWSIRAHSGGFNLHT